MYFVLKCTCVTTLMNEIEWSPTKFCLELCNSVIQCPQFYLIILQFKIKFLILVKEVTVKYYCQYNERNHSGKEYWYPTKPLMFLKFISWLIWLRTGKEWWWDLKAKEESGESLVRVILWFVCVMQNCHTHGNTGYRR